MVLKEPTNEDVRKIHAECIQITNQRFVITTLAVTVFGIIGAWMIPRGAPVAESASGAFALTGSIILTLLLFLLFFFNHFLRGMLRIFTTYLITTGKSSWEYDWERYRKTRYFGYTKTQSFVFLVLGVLSTSYPVILAQTYSLKLVPEVWLWADIVIGVMYVALVYAMGFRGLWDPEPIAKKRWQELANQQTPAS